MWIDTSIRYFLWFLLFVGLWLVVYPLFSQSFERAKQQTSRLLKKEVKTANRFVRATERFLEVTLNVRSSFAVLTFYFLMSLVAVLSFVGLYNSGRSIVEAFVWMFIGPAIIFGFLLLRLHQMRINLSYEGKEMVTELLNNYRIHHMNIVEAVDQTVYGLGSKYPLSKKTMTRLALGLKDYRNEEELREVVDDLIYQINAKWAILLANLIFIAASKGDDISEGLMDITKDLSELDQINEKNRQLNIEGGLMLKVVVPLMYIGGIFTLVKLLDFTLGKYLSYQFNNPIGFTMFYYSTIVTLFTILLYLFFRKEKNDF